MLRPPCSSAFLLLFLVWSCSGGSSGSPDSKASLEDTLRRERAVVHAAGENRGKARAELAPLVEREDALVEDLVHAAVIELKDMQLDKARAFVERGQAKAPDAPAFHYLLARLAIYDGDFDAALEHYRTTLAATPDDLATKLGLAKVLWDLEPEDEELMAEYEAEARKLCREILEVGIENGTIWYVSAAYRMYQMSVMSDDEEEQRHYRELWDQLQDRGYEAVRQSDLDEGQLARIQPPRPAGNEVAAGPSPPTFRAEAPILTELAGATDLSVHDLDADRWADVLAWGPNGLWVALQPEGKFTALQLTEDAVDLALALDLNQNTDLDVFYAVGRELRLLEHDAGEWTDTPLELPTLPSAPADAVAVDVDHDGDLDLLLVGDFGARLLRNDGAGLTLDKEKNPLPRGSFVDATAEAGLPMDIAFEWCTTEDMDGDQDVDLLLGGPSALFLASNVRGGRFEDRTSAVFGETRIARRPVVADFTGDARPDAFVPGDPATLLVQRPDGSLEARAVDASVPAGSRAQELDLDLDGSVDVFWERDGRLAEGVLALGLDSETTCELGEVGGSGAIAFADIDFGAGIELAHEIVRLTGAGIEIYRSDSPIGGAGRFKFVGVKDNRQAVGAVVEVRARAKYRRVYWRGDAVLIGVGDERFFDIVRVTWPNGVIQSELDVEKGDQYFLDEDKFSEQAKGFIGSCPYLYTWNGETFVFVTDVLGATPLGLPMAPGQLVPPDHDEFVLVRGDQLVPRDGVYELQFTEELREVTYLDRVRLDVVDHPVGTEIYPDERFTFPPFPEPHTHTVREPLVLTRATDGDGRDWTSELAVVDDVHAAPFEPLAPQFMGLATPHSLELEFDAEALRDAPKLRLVMTGWFYWTDASVNVAAARTPGVEFVPPILEVPTADGGWRSTGPPIGFPAGKTKSMVVDVTDLLDRDDPRLRLSSTLRLYWDSIRLAVDSDDEELRVTSLEPAGARLWHRGFSAAIETDCEEVPTRFDWDVVATDPRWNQHPGLYTHFGETLPLVQAIDDEFVVMGSGDALTVRFDATSLPPVPEGFVRDYLVFLDGWAKDRDPNTVEALEVEPLPFHGMSGYPYRPDEAYPDDDRHREYRRRWNTRAAFDWIVPLSPAREREWALSR